MKEAVAFATLFLGLTVGQQPVEILAGSNVAAVEIRVDGRPIAQLFGEPWKTECNLGPTLRPRNLEAIAYSAEGEEIGKASQWLNIPRDQALAEILLDSNLQTGEVIARLRSTSLVSEEPESVTAQFDGLLIESADPTRIVLPPHDPKQLHYLRVDFAFPEGRIATVEKTFGGSFVDDIATELTAVPLMLSDSSRELDLERPAWLLTGGDRASVVDVISGPADILMIRDQSSQAELDRMVRRTQVSYRSVAKLRKDSSLRIVRPLAERMARSDGDLSLYRELPAMTSKQGGLLWLLTRVRAPKAPPRLQRLSDAIAVAGVSAASSKHRRAVVLLLGPQPTDNSQYTPREVRDYLASMHVPLIVWSTEGERETPWGHAADASTMARFERQTKRLNKLLDRQRIVWVRGVYQPPEISLVESTRATVRLAGS